MTKVRCLEAKSGGGLTYCTGWVMMGSAESAPSHPDERCLRGKPAGRECFSFWSRPHQCEPPRRRCAASRCRRSPLCGSTMRGAISNCPQERRRSRWQGAGLDRGGKILVDKATIFFTYASVMLVLGSRATSITVVPSMSTSWQAVVLRPVTRQAW